MQQAPQLRMFCSEITIPLENSAWHSRSRWRMFLPMAISILRTERYVLCVSSLSSICSHLPGPICRRPLRGIYLELCHYVWESDIFAMSIGVQTLSSPQDCTTVSVRVCTSFRYLALRELDLRWSHGLSYTTFSLSSLKLSAPFVGGTECGFVATVTVTNTGAISGSEVVQLYITLPSTPEYTHPVLQLRAFSKIQELQPGKAMEVDIPLDKYAVSYWNDKIHSWVVEKGVYSVQVGVSSENIALEGTVELKEGFEWNGL